MFRSMLMASTAQSLAVTALAVTGLFFGVDVNEARAFDYSNPQAFTATETISDAKSGQKIVIDGAGTPVTITVTGPDGILSSTDGLSDVPGGPGLTIGVDYGSNTLDITNGGKVYAIGSGNGNTTDSVIGYAINSSNNAVSVAGVGSVFILTSGTDLNSPVLACDGGNCPTLYVGRNGNTNSLSITDGGYVGTGQMRLGDGAAGYSNNVSVDGAGSQLDVLWKLKIGQGGGGNSIDVTNGAKVYVDADADGAFTDGGYTALGYKIGSNSNNLTVDGAGSLFATSALYIGSDGTLFSGGGGANNTVTVSGGAVLDVGGNLYLRNNGLLSASGASTVNIEGLTDGDVTSTIEMEDTAALQFGVGSRGSNTLGNLTLSSGTLFAISAAGSASGDYTKLDITTAASIAGKAYVNVGDAYEDNTLFSGSTLSGVITCSACGDIGNFSQVYDNSLAYNFIAVKNGANQIDFEITSTGVTSLADALEATGQTGGSDAARVLDAILANGPSDFSELLSTLFGASNNQEVADAVAQTLPLLTGGTQQQIIDTGRTTAGIVSARLNGEAGMAAGDSYAGRTFWLKSFGSWADQNDSGGVSGYDAETGGVALGGDAMVSDKTRLGVAFVYAHSNVDSNSAAAPQSDRINSYQGVVYGSYNINDRMSATLQASVATNSNDGKRNIGFLGVTALSSFDSLSEHVSASLSNLYQLSEATTFVPSLKADFTNIDTESYSETGAGLFNLNVDSSSAQSLIVGIDGKITHALSQSVMLNANAGIGYDTLGQDSSVTSSYVGGGGAFATQGIDLSPWIGNAGAGVTFAASDSIDISAQYDLEARSDFTNQTASLKLKFAF